MNQIMKMALLENNRFLGKTNPIIAVAKADGGSVFNSDYIQRCARQIVDMGHWDNLVGWWDAGVSKLRNSGGVDYISNAYDISGNSNDGVQATTTRQPAISGVGMLFDGSDDYLNAGNNVSVNITGAITVMAWVYANGFVLENIVSKGRSSTAVGDAATSPFNFIVNAGKPTFQIWKDVNTRTTVVAPSAIDTGEWVRIAAKWDGTTGTDNLALYINGSAVDSSSQNTVDSIFSSAYNLTIGYDIVRASTNFAWDGLLADVRLYNTGITDAEEAAIYNVTKGRYGL